jgi:hypothetical protein
MARTRSPHYPACSLDDAVAMITRFWRKEERTAVDSDTAAKAIGYKGLSGPSRTGLASLKKYGLLSDEKQGMRVSPLALRILNPPDEYDKLQALREAALKPELFKQLSDTHPNASDDALRSHLINTLGFSDTGARTLIKSFRDTMQFAKLPDLEYSPTQGEDMETLQVGKREVRSATGTKALRTFSWPLSAETTARLEIVGNEELTSAHIDALSQYLEVAKKLLKPAKN